MKKLFSFFAAALIAGGMLATVLAVSPATYAQSPAARDIIDFARSTAIKGGLTEAGATDRDPYDVVSNIINVVLGLVGIIFFIQMFWAGFRWMTAGGNEEVINESKGTIKSAIIGVTIALLAFGITNFIFNQVQTVAGS